MDNQQRTALHLASEEGHAEVVGVLLTDGLAKVDAVDNKKRTALHLASEGGHEDALKKLLAAGAEVSAEAVVSY